MAYFTHSANIVPKGARAIAAHVNNVASEIQVGFDKLPTETELKQGKVNYSATETGTANSYIITLPYAPALEEGLKVSFKITNSCTTASTLNVNGTGFKNLALSDGTSTSAGDLPAGQIIAAVYNGTEYRITSGLPSLTARAVAAALAAEASETAAATSESNAATSETNASNSASSSSASASASSISAGESAASAATASTDASTATTKAAEAVISASAASTSAGNALTSENNASNSEDAAAASETVVASNASAAAISETNASISESNAAASETAAGLSETAAAASETAAGLSETAAASSESSASTDAATATTKASEASASAGTATTQAGIATTQAGIATSQASSATTSALTATTQASSATTSASTATTQASAASTSATNALASENKAELWADEEEDIEVETGVYSAKHWALKSAAAVAQALTYQGLWDASTAAYPVSPTTGDTYKISVSGTISGTLWAVGETMIYNGSTWDQISSTETVTSVAGKVGAVTLSISDLTDSSSVITTTGPHVIVGGLTVGSLSTTGPVVGRYLQVDGPKLDGIEAGATADQTNAEIKTAYEANSNTNAFTNTHKGKVDHISVTQAVNLDTMESNITTNNAKVTNATHTGDVTGSTTLTIGANKVTLANLAQVNTDTFLGRTTAATGNVESLTASQARAILNVEDGATADQSNAQIKTAYEANSNTNAYTDTEQTKLSGIATSANNYSHPNHTGDVTSSGDGAQTIVNNAVSLAKMADIATASFLGRVSAATGDPEVLTATQARTLLNVEDGANNYTHPASHAISFITGLQTALDGKKATFSENTGFNKNLGTTAGTVAEGNHTHSQISFRGCLAYLTATTTVNNSTVAWNTTSYDTDSIWSAGVPQKLTVPTGVTKVKISASLLIQAGTNNYMAITKNGSESFIGSARSPLYSNEYVYNNINTAVITVTPGDYFQLYIQGSVFSFLTSFGRNWLSMEIIE